VSLSLFRRTVAGQAAKLVVIVVAIFLWGLLMPIIYSQFGVQFRELMQTGLIPEQFANFGGGNIFSLPGSIALGFIHPIALILTSVFAVGFASSAVAGERQRGTLEVLLARPISRRRLYVTLLVATLLFIGLVIAGILAGTLVGAAAGGVLDEVDVGLYPLAWLNGWLLFAALASIGLAASVSFDRLTPALGIAGGVTIVSYFLQVLGSLWPDAEVLQPYSLFHYFDPQAVLAGKADPFGFFILAAVAIAGVVVALVAFPRRDIAAPS
jgi:ABC-2 type transport system permease protein